MLVTLACLISVSLGASAQMIAPTLACLISVSLGASAQMIAPTQLPVYLLQPLVQSGAVVISNTVKADRAQYETAMASFSTANSSCSHFVESRKKPCGDCIKQKCEARMKSVCKPEQWQIILGSIVNLVGKDIPDLFSKALPAFITQDIGANVIKVGQEIGNFFTGTIPGGFETIGTGVIDFGKDIGKLGTNIGNEIVGFGKDIGKGVVGLGNGIVDGITDWGKNIGSGFTDILGGLGKIFGKRQADQEPNCDAFEKDANRACLYYMKSCSACDIDLERDCSALHNANSQVKAATTAASWLNKYKQPDFIIHSVTYDATSFDPITQGFSKIEVEATFFGRKDKFMLTKPVQPFNPVAAGPLIAQIAMDRFKAAA